MYHIRRVSAYSHVEHAAFFCVDDPFVDRFLLGVVDHFAASKATDNTNNQEKILIELHRSLDKHVKKIMLQLNELNLI